MAEGNTVATRTARASRLAVQHVAVTGMGIVSALGSNVDTFWRNLVAGRSAIARADPALQLSGNGLWAAVTDEMLPHGMVRPGALRNTARFTKYALLATEQALRAAALKPPDRAAIVMGNSMGGFPLVAEMQDQLRKRGARAVTPKLIGLVSPNVAAARIAWYYKLRGAQLTISTACASAIDAVGIASRMIERGEADVAIAGGTEAVLCELIYESLFRSRAISHNPDPLCASRPFDADSDGFVMADGAAMLVLESVEHALARGVPVLARIRGYGSNTDGHHFASPEPSARYAIKVMRDAIDEAGDLGSACNVVYAHATGNAVDAVEAKAIGEVYGSQSPLVTSTKGHSGHSFAADGAMCLVAGITGMHQGCVSPTIGTRRLDSNVSFELVRERARERSYAAFATNAFGLGGQNASLIVSR